jgi:site-specific recombinase XerD
MRLKMMIIIRSGKGMKDRCVPLSANILEMLRNYYLRFVPKRYVFEEHQSALATP